MLKRYPVPSGSKKKMEFGDVLYGNELSCWDGTSFVAPVDGIYTFSLNIVTNAANRNYRIRVLANDEYNGVDQL